MSVLLQVVCTAHSPVCNTHRIALRKIVNSFNELGGGGGGGALLSLLVEWRDVGGPGEILCNVHPQEFRAAGSLHGWAVDGQWGVINRVSSEVHHNLFCLTHIEGQVVCTTPFSQWCHFLSVVRFIVVADEAYHCCVISKLDVVW